MTTIQIENLGTELNKIIGDLSMYMKALIAKEVVDLPQKFELQAKAYYPSVLHRHSGHLVNSIQQVARQGADKDTWEIGLKNDMEYAHVQHEGFDGFVQVLRKAHRRKQGLEAYTRSLRQRAKGIGVMGMMSDWVMSSVFTRHMKIPATHFLSIPITVVMSNWTGRIMDKIIFRK